MKNLKNSILALSLFVVSQMFGQTTPEVQFATVDRSTPIEEVSYEYLMADKVYLRESASLKSKRLAVLDIGTKLILREKSENYEVINGIKSHWYCVNIGADEGWVLGSLIAQKTFGSQAYHDVKFVYGYKSVTTNEAGVLENKHQLRAYKNGVELHRIVFDGHKSTPLTMENIGNKGLFNVEDIIALDIPDANDSIIGKTYIFWNNGKFTNVASLKDHSDATYSKSESFIFPSDMEGKKSTIVLKTNITTYTTSLENEVAKANTECITSFFKWDGRKLVKKENTPIVSDDVIASNFDF